MFDHRLGERITDDIISQCHQCGKPCDNHTNCANDACHLLFIQCDECKAIMGFPKKFKIPVSRTQMYRQFGNAVAVPVIRKIARSMAKTLEKLNNKSNAR